MAGRRSRTAVRRRVPVRAKRRRVPRTSGTTKRNPFTGLLVTGIRSIVAALPLSTFLSPITDMLMSAIGLTSKAVKARTTSVVQEDVSIYGLCGMVMISYVNILVRSSNASLDDTKGARPYVNTPYTDAKLTSMSVTVTPDNKQQSRSGRWGAVVIPFRDAKDQQTIQSDYAPIPLSRLQQMAGSVSGPADKPLTVRFVPRAEDGLIYQFNPMNTYFCALVISYSENIRSNYHEFTAEDFGPDVSVKGQLRLRQPHFGSPVVGFEDLTWSPNIPMGIYNDDSKSWQVFESKDFKCEKQSNGMCKVTGVLKEKEKAEASLTLDSMAIE